MAEETDDAIRVNGGLRVPASELTWRFSGSGGPGGQHANTSNTRVEVVFDVAGSATLGPRQRARLLERLGPEVRVVVSDERSQSRNRSIARRRLGERLAEGLRPPPPRRRPTRATRASKERRLKDKRQRSELKARRRRPPID